MAKILPIEKRRRRYRKPKVDKEIAGALADLRQYVENIGQGRIMLIGDTYKKQQIAKVYTTAVNPWVFGYQVLPLNPDEGFYTRNIFLKIPVQPILEVPEAEIDPVYGAIFEALIDKGADLPEIEHIAVDAVKISQNFTVMFLIEKNPNVRVPGNPATKAV